MTEWFLIAGYVEAQDAIMQAAPPPEDQAGPWYEWFKWWMTGVIVPLVVAYIGARRWQKHKKD